MKTPIPPFDLSLFDGFETYPIRDDGPHCEPCRPEEATYWTVFGHYAPGTGEFGLEALLDCADAASADRALTILQISLDDPTLPLYHFKQRRSRS